MNDDTAASARPGISVAPWTLGVDHVSKAYPGVLALDDVTVNFSSGEIVGLVGQNGAGKSTLIRLLSGAVQPDSGSLTVSGEPVRFRLADEAMHAGVACVHQELVDVPSLSVEENISLGLGHGRRAGFFISTKMRTARARGALGTLGSDIDPRSTEASLSAAERRMVLIARALSAEVKLLILDEPTASLSESEIRKLHQVLRNLRERGVATLYVSHRLDEILTLCDRIVVMRNGRVVDDGEIRRFDLSAVIASITGHSASEEHQLPSMQPRGASTSGGDRQSEAPGLEVRELLRRDQRLAALSRSGAEKSSVLLAWSGRTIGTRSYYIRGRPSRKRPGLCRRTSGERQIAARGAKFWHCLSARGSPC